MKTRWIAIICALVIVIVAGVWYWQSSMGTGQGYLPIGPGTTATSTATSTPPDGTAASSSLETASTTPHIVTGADNGATIAYHVGDRFLVDLGAAQDWSVTVGDQSVVRRVPNIAVIRGAQGVYQALAAGTTTINAVGRPICAAGQACPMYVIEFRADIAVE